MPAVSVIVPNYNHARFLRQRLDSIFSQTYKDFEVILLDDCSTDNSRVIIEQYRNHPKVSTIVYNEENSGSTFKQWEKGIEQAKGEFIWIAESDDYCDVTFLEVLVPKLIEHGKAGIAYCQTISVKSDNIPIRNWIDHTDVFVPNLWKQNFYITGPEAINNLFCFRNIIPNASGTIFSKSVYDQTTGIETNMTLNGDWFLWVKLLGISDLIFIAQNLNFFRQHSNKATDRNTINFNNLKEIFKILKYIDDKNKMSIEKKKIVINIASRMWLRQILRTNIFTSIRNFLEVQKNALNFDKYIYLNISEIIYIYMKNRLKNRRSKPLTIKLDDCTLLIKEI